MKPIIRLAALVCSFLFVIALDPFNREFTSLPGCVKGKSITQFHSYLLKKVECKTTFTLSISKWHLNFC